MARPATHAATEQVYRLLPDYVRGADENTWQLLEYLDGAANGMRPAVDFLTIADPDTSVSGTCEMVNPTAAPRAFLAWLGGLIGVDTSTIADAYVREALGNASTAQRRGSVASLSVAVQRTLVGSQYVRVFTNVGGANPYRITVVTLTSETPDVAATLLAAEAEKPAGMEIELQLVSGSTWNLVEANYADWDAVTAAHPSWDDLTTWLP